MVRALFLGRLREEVGTAMRPVFIEDSVDFDDFLVRAVEGVAELAERLREPDVRVAVNARLVAPGAFPKVLSGDEVAFMPVFSGG